METIGLIGGMSWESSAVYYRDLNLGVQQRLGGLSSPKLVLSTVDFAEVTHLEDEERWHQIGELLAEAARGVERAGADFLMLCTTTFHKVADQVEAAVDIPLVHLADVVAQACVAEGVTTVGFIGTKVAMWTGSLMLAMMYVSHSWPGAGGNPNNPFIDDHIVYILAIIGIVLVELTRQAIGLGSWWRKLGIVKRWSWLV